ERMNIICQRFDALGKALRVRNDVSIPVAINLPAVIDDHVLITSILHARLHHRIGHPANHLVAHVAAEFIPTVPPHGRSECKIGRWSGALREESSGGEYQNGRAQPASNRLHKWLLKMAVTFLPERKTSGRMAATAPPAPQCGEGIGQGCQTLLRPRDWRSFPDTVAESMGPRPVRAATTITETRL